MPGSVVMTTWRQDGSPGRRRPHRPRRGDLSLGVHAAPLGSQHKHAAAVRLDRALRPDRDHDDRRQPRHFPVRLPFRPRRGERGYREVSKPDARRGNVRPVFWREQGVQGLNPSLRTGTRSRMHFHSSLHETSDCRLHGVRAPGTGIWRGLDAAGLQGHHRYIVSVVCLEMHQVSRNSNRTIIGFFLKKHEGKMDHVGCQEGGVASWQ